MAASDGKIASRGAMARAAGVLLAELACGILRSPMRPWSVRGSWSPLLLVISLAGCNEIAGLDDVRFQDPVATSSGGSTTTAAGGGGGADGGASSGGGGASPASGVLWAKRFGHESQQLAGAVAFDEDDNVLLAANFAARIDFGWGNWTSGGLFDLAIGKFDSDGSLIWGDRFGGATDDMARSIAADSSGNVYVTGYLGENVSFGGDTFPGENDLFVVKFDPDGNHLWSQAFGTNSSDLGIDLAFDDADNLLVLGLFKGAVDFGGGALQSAGNHDFVILKLSPAGDHLWSKRYGGVGYEGSASFSVDAAGNILLGGRIDPDADFDGTPVTGAGGIDAVVAKLDASGTLTWAETFGTAAEDNMDLSIVANPAGEVFAAGGLQNPVDFGGGMLTPAGPVDAVIFKLDAAGSHAWSKLYGDGAEQAAWDIALLPDGDLLVTGRFGGELDTEAGTLSSSGGDDVFLLVLDGATGEAISARQYGDASHDHGTRLAVSPQVGFALAGDFEGGIDFGTGLLTSLAESDVFLARFAH